MPKVDIDYSNTIIYKIHCKDSNVTEIYVGHTTNFTKRKYAHKTKCNMVKNKIKIYSIIRQNGGWDNWDMVEIAKYNCKDKTEARIKEQHHYEELKANLNSCPPFVDKNSYFCKLCNLQCKSPKGYNNHINCTLHINKMGNKCVPKNAEFYCFSCDFKCFKKSNFETHCNTKKHIHRVNGNEMKKEEIKNAEHICKCGKIYSTNSGLWKHKKLCNNDIQQNIEKNEISDKELIMMVVKQNAELMKENSEMRNMMMGVIKTGTHNTTNNNTNTNSHNKTFNLNFFLNETCKDALNINDFVSSIKVSLTDLENTGRQGYVEGVSNIILKNLNNLEQYQRPIHCSDFKREVIYIKDNDKWEKECEEKPLLTKAIKVIANENIKKIMEWKETNPDCTNSDSKKNNLYLKIVSNSMNGSNKEEGTKNITKIISNVAKETIIQKES